MREQEDDKLLRRLTTWVELVGGDLKTRKKKVLHHARVRDMAQGGLKKGKDKFVGASSKGKSKASKRKKPLGPRKGGHYIAPKKAPKVKADKLKKQLQKQIGQHIEQEIHQRATKEGNEFRILGNKSSSSEPDKKTAVNTSSSSSKTGD